MKSVGVILILSFSFLLDFIQQFEYRCMQKAKIHNSSSHRLVSKILLYKIIIWVLDVFIQNAHTIHKPVRIFYKQLFLLFIFS